LAYPNPALVYENDNEGVSFSKVLK